jgi:5-hydroxyisourate hydrolase
MSGITTHVLDTTIGRPVVGLPVLLEALIDGWQECGRAVTGEDGRAMTSLCGESPLRQGLYRLRFGTACVSRFFPEVTILFHVEDESQHYHLPLLLCGNSYTTYRGS